MSDRPSALERLTSALSSSDLSFDPDHRTDLDYLVAAGIAASRNGAVALPLMNIQLASRPSDLHAAYEAVLVMVKRMNVKKAWGLAQHSVHAVALNALSHHVDPTCPHCQGRKYELQDGAPVLSVKHCKHCRGTGRRPIQKKHQEQINAVIATLEQIDSTTERAVARLVR